MDALKKFLGKKKTDKKFKAAGPGHRLTDSNSNGQGSASGGQRGFTPKKTSPKQRVVPTEERKAAVDAALARLEQKKSATDPNELLAHRQLKFIQEQARKEIEAEKRLKEQAEEVTKSGTEKASNVKSDNDQEASYTMRAEKGQSVDPKFFAVTGVYFTCPIVGPAVGTRPEIEEDIYNFLLAQMSEDLGVTSCLLIHSCNKGRVKIQACVETLCKYLDNIINHPTEPKYRKIRSSNKVFQEKVCPLRGASEFLQAAGFSKCFIKPDTATESHEEEFWVYEPGEDAEGSVGALTELRESLQSTSPIKAELDRNMQVLMPAQVMRRRELPSDFYELTGEEFKREQRLRSEIAERELRLRTKAQRERDEVREQRLYKFCLMRIRFPDGFTLQGTFRATEKIGDVYAFVAENLALEDLEFSLKKSGSGDTLSDLEASIAEMKLAPASILNFKLESELPVSVTEFSFLRPEVLALVQHME